VIKECGHQYSVDWWGLGVLIFEMTTMERPFTEGDQMQVGSTISSLSHGCSLV
jgi:serine/threonine protein kinase